VLRVGFKPTATLLREQNTVNREHQETTLKGRGRHDPCVLPRAVPMVESMVLLVLADHWLRQRAISH
jgi:chorismate synthase